MTKITIISEDKAVGKDGVFYDGLDFSGCGCPENFWALQWGGASGHIEYDGPMVQNDEITALPDWANACVAKWDEADSARIAAEEAAAAAAEAAAAGAEQAP